MESSGSTSRSKLLKVTFFTAEEWSRKCCGLIGSTGKFCIEDKVPKSSHHCGRTSHATKKIFPDNNVYYAPAGIQYGNQAADSDPSLHTRAIPTKWREHIKMGLFTQTQWVDILLKAGTENRHAKKAGAQETGEDISMSISMSGFSNGGKKCELTYPWEEVEGDEEQMYDRAANRHAQLKAFDDIKKVVLKGYREIRETNTSRQLRIEMAVANQLGDFAPYLHRHGSFKKAIEETVKPVMAPVVERQAEFRSEVEQAFKQVAADVKDGKGECMEMMRKTGATDRWVGDFCGSNDPSYHCRCKHGSHCSGCWRESGVCIVWTLVPEDEGDGSKGISSHRMSQVCGSIVWALGFPVGIGIHALHGTREPWKYWTPRICGHHIYLGGFC